MEDLRPESHGRSHELFAKLNTLQFFKCFVMHYGLINKLIAIDGDGRQAESSW